MKQPRIAVGALIFNDNREILLIKSPKYNSDWIVPGGHVEEGESLAEACKREIKEETDLEVEIIDQFGFSEHIFDEKVSKSKHFIFIDYICKTKNNDVELDNKEAVEYIWIKPTKAIKLEKIGSSTKNFIKNYINNYHSKKWLEFVNIMRQLRIECPWDAEQTLESIDGSLTDEVRELKEGVLAHDLENIKEEIGDVLTNLILMGVIAEEKRFFKIEDIFSDNIKKLIRRHPHVFGDIKGKFKTKEEVLENWKKIKELEKRN